MPSPVTPLTAFDEDGIRDRAVVASDQSADEAVGPGGDGPDACDWKMLAP